MMPGARLRFTMHDTPPPFTTRRQALCAGLGTLALPWHAALQAQTAAAPDSAPRVALVIGNSAYREAPLRNPANDAQAMGETLTAMGFQVLSLRDGTRQQMQALLARAAQALQGRQGVGLLYYAGHGLQVDWRNFMMPVDAAPQTAADVARQAVDVQEVVETFRRAGTRVNIVVLDACRDNPFGASGSNKGLAPMDAPPGTLLAYATAPGNVAEDGDLQSGHGLYTRYLVQELRKPSVPIESIFKRVRLQVRRDSDGRQIPWESTSLEEDFYFAGAPAATEAAQDEAELAAEKAAQQQAEAWAAVAQTGSAREVTDFLLRFPGGPLAEQAQFRLDQLQRRKTVVQKGRDAPSAPAPGEWRYRVGDVLDYAIGGPQQRPGRQGQPRGTVSMKVTAADAQRVEFNQGRIVTDQLGTSLQEGGFRKVPGHVKVPAELHAGKRWETRFDVLQVDNGQLRARLHWNYRVAGLETVAVQAGTFRAWRIEGRGVDKLEDGPLARIRRLADRREHTMWVDSATLVIVKEETERQANGRRTRAEERELVALKLAPR